MQHLEVSCAVRRFFKSLGFKGLKEVGLTLSQATKALKESRDIALLYF